MRNLPDFNSDNPIIQKQNVSSLESGDSSIQDALGKISQTAATGAIDINKNVSQVNLFQQSGLIDDAKTSALEKIEAATSPAQIGAIQDGFKNNLSTIMANSKLDNEDRKTLQQLSLTTGNSVALQTADHTLDLTRRQQGFDFLQGFQEQMPQISSLMSSGDPGSLKAAHDRMSSLENTAYLAYMNKAIDFSTLKMVYKKASSLVQAHIDYGEAVQKGNTDAITQNTLAQTTADPINKSLNTDESVNQVTDYQGLEASKENLKSSVTQIQPDGSVNIPAQSLAACAKNASSIGECNAYIEGTFAARGVINGGSYPQMAQRMDLLKNSKNITNVERGELQTYQNYMAKFKNDFYNTLLHTVPGQKALDKTRGQMPGVKDDDPEFQIALASNLKDTANGMHFPPDIIKPFNDETLAPVSQAFQPGGNIDSAVDYIHSHNFTPPTAATFSNSFNREDQQQAVYTSALLKGTAGEGISKFILAGASTSVNPLTGKPSNAILDDYFDKEALKNAGITENYIRTKVLSDPNIQRAVVYIANKSSNDPKQGPTNAGAFNDVLSRAVVAMSKAQNDQTLSNLNSNINILSKSITGAYDITTGSGYSFNKKEMPGLVDSDGQRLYNYSIQRFKDSSLLALNDALKNAKTEEEKSDIQKRIVNFDNQFKSIQDRSSFNVNYDASGNITVGNGLGLLYSYPYSSNILASARLLDEKNSSENSEDAFQRGKMVRQTLSNIGSKISSALGGNQ